MKQFTIGCVRLSIMFLVEGDVSDYVNTSGDVSIECGV